MSQIWTPEPRQKRSIICITVQRDQPAQIEPDPAIVPVGDTVIWQLRYPGEAFRGWLADLLTNKLEKQAEVKMSDLKSGALIYASRRGHGTLRFSSSGERKETSASFAVRCSMSIPIFFHTHPSRRTSRF